ncbi:MAG: helix-turn-helix domain-containing protein [Oscillospiraceae bacterium]
MELRIGSEIQRLRRQSNSTQQQLADAMGVTGAAVSKWESGASYPDITLLPRLARYLNITVDELLCFEQALPEEKALEIEKECRDALRQNTADGLELCRRFLREYPGSLYLKYRIGGALMMREMEGRGKAGEETAKLSTRLMEEVAEGQGYAEEGLRKKLMDAAQGVLPGLYLMTEDLESAERAAQKLPDNSREKSMLLCSILQRKGDYKEAQKQAQQGLFADGISLQNHLICLAGLAEREERIADAEEIYLTLLRAGRALGFKGQTNYGMNCLLLAALYLKQNKTEKAKGPVGDFAEFAEGWQGVSSGLPGQLYGSLTFTAPNTEMGEMLQREYIQFLQQKEFDPIRDTPVFARAMQAAEKLEIEPKKKAEP